MFPLQIIGQALPVPLPLLAAIRSPSFLNVSLAEFLFNTHWPLWIAAALLGALLIYLSQRRADPRLRNVGGIILAMAFVWAISAALIDTPSERLYRVHKDLSTAASAGDVDRLVSFLAPDFQSSALGIASFASAKDEIAARLKSNGIHDSLITGYKVNLENPRAATRLTLITQTDSFGPVKTSWELDWEDIPDQDWRIQEAALVQVGDQRVNSEMVIPR